jgi:hypothetical protein
VVYVESSGLGGTFTLPVSVSFAGLASLASVLCCAEAHAKAQGTLRKRNSPIGHLMWTCCCEGGHSLLRLQHLKLASLARTQRTTAMADDDDTTQAITRGRARFLKP